MFNVLDSLSEHSVDSAFPVICASSAQKIPAGALDGIRFKRPAGSCQRHRSHQALAEVTANSSPIANSNLFTEPVGRQRIVSLDVNSVTRFKLIFMFQPFVGGF